MTAQQAFCAAIFAGLVPTARFDAALISRLAWWDETCELVLLATEVLTELGTPRTAVELGKCLVAEGFTVAAAAELAAEVCSVSSWRIGDCGAWVLDQLGAAA
jgi:hypothetical protein